MLVFNRCPDDVRAQKAVSNNRHYHPVPYVISVMA